MNCFLVGSTLHFNVTAMGEKNAPPSHREFAALTADAAL
jgi:hypothetical protein